MSRWIDIAWSITIGAIIGTLLAVILRNPICECPKDLITAALLQSGEIQIIVYDGDGHEMVSYTVDPEEPIGSAISEVPQ